MFQPLSKKCLIQKRQQKVAAENAEEWSSMFT